MGFGLQGQQRLTLLAELHVEDAVKSVELILVRTLTCLEYASLGWLCTIVGYYRARGMSPAYRTTASIDLDTCFVLVYRGATSLWVGMVSGFVISKTKLADSVVSGGSGVLYVVLATVGTCTFHQVPPADIFHNDICVLVMRGWCGEWGGSLPTPTLPTVSAHYLYSMFV